MLEHRPVPGARFEEYNEKLKLDLCQVLSQIIFPDKLHSNHERGYILAVDKQPIQPIENVDILGTIFYNELLMAILQLFIVVILVNID